ncbi:MAG: aminotransferase class V-fold PLP-dependent enzyme [Acidimicrobiales bacterium]
MGDDWHYLDHAATTPLRPEALAAMMPALHGGRGNPSGAHALARRARADLDGAREDLAGVVGCEPGEIVFTSGGTEADNLAVRGVLSARPGTAICTAIEHHAVLRPVEAAGGRIVPVDRRGVVDLEAMATALDENVSLVSIGLVNNELGTIQPLTEIAAVVREQAPNALLHTDAAQALCWLDLRHHAAAADLVTLVAHKCGGPVGTGALVVRAGVTLQAQQLGGGQERERRSGTQDVAGALGFAAAAIAAAHEREALVDRATTWRDELAAAITRAVPGAVESAAGDDGDRRHLVAGIANLCLPAVDSEALLFMLEHDHRVLASAASSCASGAQEPSHVLAALGLPRALAAGSLRLSLGWSTTQADIDAAAVGVPDAVRRLQTHVRDGAPA